MKKKKKNRKCSGNASTWLRNRTGREQMSHSRTLPLIAPRRLAKASDAAQDTTTLNKRIEELTAEVSELKKGRMQLQEGKRRLGASYETHHGPPHMCQIFLSNLLKSGHFDRQNNMRLMIAGLNWRVR